MNFFGGIYRGKKVLVTGHTGFKGSWLSLWLHELGANISGISLSLESSPNHWNMLGLTVDDHRIDVRDFDSISKVVQEIQPDIVFHLAAQPLVRRSYRDPLETWSTNVMGTANILEACRLTSSVKSILVVTTDKCYQNNEWIWGYRETDSLGGHDPYSASKACAELVVASYRDAFFNGSNDICVATARAGNVIGGGDWSEDRLIPDLVSSMQVNKSTEIRSPNSTRPWQHVLEPLSGYLLLGQKLFLRDRAFADAWNFGPDSSGNQSVSEILIHLEKTWKKLKWHTSSKNHQHEANLLYLDSSKARNLLHWKPVWDIDISLEKTALWYIQWMQNGQTASRKQLAEFIEDSINSDAIWVDK